MTQRNAEWEMLETVLAGDEASRALGLSLLEAGPGRACLALQVSAAMTNKVGICHGGYIFAAADSACAFACMTGGESAVVQSSHIVFNSPAHVGETLAADASVVALGRRGGTVDARVTAGDGRLVALVRCACRTSGIPLSATPPR